MDSRFPPSRGRASWEWLRSGTLRIACHSREGGNPSVFADHVRRSTGHVDSRRPFRYSREGGNPFGLSEHECASGALTAPAGRTSNRARLGRCRTQNRDRRESSRRLVPRRAMPHTAPPSRGNANRSGAAIRRPSRNPNRKGCHVEHRAVAVLLLRAAHGPHPPAGDHQRLSVGPDRQLPQPVAQGRRSEPHRHRMGRPDLRRLRLQFPLGAAHRSDPRAVADRPARASPRVDRHPAVGDPGCASSHGARRIRRRTSRV